MKFVLPILIVSSFLAALNAYVSAGLAWSYYPSSAIGVAFYEHTGWLFLFHITVGVILFFFSPFTKNRRAMAVAFAIFLTSILIAIGTKHIKTEKQTTVQIDDTSYRVSSFEEPTLDYRHLGTSPFRPNSGTRDPSQLPSSLHFTPKEKFGFEALFQDEDAKRFFIAIHTTDAEKLAKVKNLENAFFVTNKDYTLFFYPEHPFSDEFSAQKFQTFIETNMPLIEQDLAARTVVNPNAP